MTDRSRRTTITRMLALGCVVGAVVSIGGFIALTVIMTLPNGSLSLVWPYVLILTAFGVASQVAILALSLWRRCDRCRARLFPLIGGIISPVGKIPERPDYRAKQFLGSYHFGAVVSAARGDAICIQCGHKDGVAPDYVVTAP